jgi:hypothetical protein
MFCIVCTHSLPYVDRNATIKKKREIRKEKERKENKGKVKGLLLLMQMIKDYLV